MWIRKEKKKKKPTTTTKNKAHFSLFVAFCFVFGKRIF
jgi:hypothetical protein